MSQAETFEKMGRGYQEKVVQAIITDNDFADQMSDVLEASYFTFVHLESITKALYAYRGKYKEFPSVELIPTLLKHDEKLKADPLIQVMVTEYLKKVVEIPLAGDRAWIQESALDFCKKQAVLAAMGSVLEQVENSKYDDISRCMREALERGSPKDHGHEYGTDIDIRVQKVVRAPISTGWTPLDKVLGGGWERGTISTFIAATGVGKSMFLVNAACALVAQGLSVLYVTLEMQDWKLGLRADSWFAEIPIDLVAENKEHVEKSMLEKATGRLIIKQWPTKKATIDHIRNHVQRLKQTKNFIPDAIVVDYADLLKPMGRYGEKRHELEANYEELRAMAAELNVVVLTADQTNREGLECELVTIAQIGEAYAKATVCDLIMTITRTQEMKSNGIGKLYNAKSRLGPDGQVFDFLMDTSKHIKVQMLEHGQDATGYLMNIDSKRQEYMRNRVKDMMSSGTVLMKEPLQ